MTIRIVNDRPHQPEVMTTLLMALGVTGHPIHVISDGPEGPEGPEVIGTVIRIDGQLVLIAAPHDRDEWVVKMSDIIEVRVLTTGP